MGIKLQFFIKDLPGHPDTEINKEFPSDMSFLEAVRTILVNLGQGITLDRIAVISDKKGIMSWEDVRNTVLNVMIAHRVKFTLVDRAKVFGPNLEDVETESITSLSSIDSIPVKMTDVGNELDNRQEIFAMDVELDDKISGEMEEEVALRKSDMDQLEFFMEKEAEMDPEMAIAVDALKSKQDSIEQTTSGGFLGAPPSGPPGGGGTQPPPPPSGGMPPQPKSPHESEIMKEAYGKKMKKKGKIRRGLSSEQKSLMALQDTEELLPPPPPESVPSIPRPSPAPARTSTFAPKPVPKPLPEPSRTAASVPLPGITPSRNVDEIFELPSRPPEMKERSILPETFGATASDSASSSELTSELQSTEKAETPVSSPDSILQTSKEYEKHLFIEYFDKMNPKKYYPMQVNLSDLEYMVTGSSENVVTGERQTQVKDTMQVELISSLVTVQPMFPGCSVVPEHIETDLNQKEDELTFYITPFVEDDLDAGCVEFRDATGSVFHVVKTPSKVVDPRYSRVVAFYGVMISFFPKILAWLGFDFINEISVPFLAGELALTNVIGVVGIGLTIIVSLIVNFTRKPHSMKNEFTIGDIRKKLSEKKVNTIPWTSSS